MLEYLGIFGALLFIAADIPYLRDIFRYKTKPHRVSWFIVMCLNIIFVANQTASGATNSLWLVYAAVLMTVTIFLLSLKYGVGGGEKLDYFCLAGAVVGLVLWRLLNTPVASTVSNILVANIALLPTFKKSYTDPYSETMSTWLIAAISGLIVALSVGSWSLKLLIFPLNDFFIQFAVFFVIWTRRRQVAT